MKKALVSTSKFLSLVLRHRPEAIGVPLDAEGWIDVDRLLAACSRHGKEFAQSGASEKAGQVLLQVCLFGYFAQKVPVPFFPPGPHGCEGCE